MTTCSSPSVSLTSESREPADLLIPQLVHALCLHKRVLWISALSSGSPRADSWSRRSPYMAS
jgi:hypothetical protein